MNKSYHLNLKLVALQAKIMIALSALKTLLATPQKIVITTHHKPDGDAMGSSLGLYAFLIQEE